MGKADLIALYTQQGRGSLFDLPTYSHTKRTNCLYATDRKKSVREKEVHIRHYVNNDPMILLFIFFFNLILSFAINKYMYFTVFGMSNF